MPKTQNPVPVTAAEMTQTNIDHSVKIGKQVIKAKLKETRDKQVEIRSAAMKLMNKIFPKNKDIETQLRKNLKSTINNCKAMNSFRSGYNFFSETKASTNWGLVSDDDCANIACTIGSPSNFKLEEYEKMMDTMTADIDFYLYIGTQEIDKKQDVDSLDNGFTYTVNLPSKLLPGMTNMLKQLKIVSQADNTMSKIDDKLHNINDTMEEMEAKLLTQELNRSDTGKDVLNIASSIITDVIGDTIQLALNTD